MKIRVLGWEYENIRRMKHLKVDLEQESRSVYPYSLIMMANGTGKTTTLYLIRAVLSGSAVRWKEREVRAYHPTFADSTDISEGKFILKMEFDDEVYYYVLHLNYEEGKAWYETSSAMMMGGYEEGWQSPYSLRGILDSEGFVDRFIFDGEQAKKTLDSGSMEAESAIVYLYQLDKLDQLRDVIDRQVERNQEQSSGGITERSVKVHKGKMEKREQKLQELRQQKQALDRDLEKMKKKQQEYERKYHDILAQDDQIQSEQERLLTEQEENRRDVDATVAELMNCIKKPYNLQMEIHTRMKALVENMQALKLPKTTAQEFFRDLAKGEECICGHHIGEAERATILAKAQEYLGQDSLIVVNAVKGALNEYERSEDCEQLESHLKEAMKTGIQIDSGLNRLAAKAAERGHEEILKVKEDSERLAQIMEDRRRQSERLSTIDYTTNTGLNQDNNIPLAEKAWKDAQENYQRASGTYDFIRKAGQMKQYIANIKANALCRLKTYMTSETNQKIKELIANDNIIIQKIDGHLVLEGKAGASEGQTLAVAYAYIGTLFEHSRFEFPFIVDSPAAPMDLSVRREVAQVLPELFQQAVIFVTSSEKKGFAEVFFEREDAQYLTIKGEKGQAVECFPGRSAFEQYQEEQGGE